MHPHRENTARALLGTCFTLIAVLLLGASAALAAAPFESLRSFELPNHEVRFTSGPDNPRTASAAWSTFAHASGQDWKVVWNEATGLPRRAFPARFDAAVAAGILSEPATGAKLDPAARAASIDAAAVDRMSRHLYAILRSSYPTLPAENDLSVWAVERKGNVWWAIYGQTSDGISVEGARADFRYSADGMLLFFGVDLIPVGLPGASGVLGSPFPGNVGGPDAENIALESLRQGGLDGTGLRTAAPAPPFAPAVSEPDTWRSASPRRETSRVLLPLISADGRALTVRPAWIVRTEVTDPPARFASWIDAVTGQVLKRENEIRYGTISGQADADVQMAEPTDPYIILPAPDLRVTVAGVGETFTDMDGQYALGTPDDAARQVTSALSGHYAAINNTGGPQPYFSGTAVPGTPFPIHWADGNSDAASRDVYYHMNAEHRYLKAIDPSFNGLDYEMPGNVNLNETCNAYWDGYSVNFFQAGGGCANTGQIPDVVYHEYGHGASQYAYAPASPSGSEGEGFSDYIACTMTDQPLVGRGFTGPGTYLRTCDNNRTWPAPECGGEVHCEGEVIAGALWHMRQNLVARLGHDPGVALADHLFHFARYGRDATYEGYYFDLLAVDDDNGTLIDGTPHAAQIIQAFHDRHNIGPGWTLDILHTPLPDSEGGVSYPVVAVFSSPASLLEDSLAVYYTTSPIDGGPTDGPHRLAMSPTGNLREYQGIIPPQTLGTRVRYYISAATDTLGLTALDPAGAPAVQHEFLVQIDSTPPVISHDVLYNKSAAIWPVTVRATVTDNQAVASVQVEWKRNGGDQAPFILARVGDSSLYAGAFNGPVAEGDRISYRIKAMDAAGTPNVSYLPALGYLQFMIVHDYADDMEHGVQDWSHAVGTPGFVDQWHLSTQRYHGVGGTHSWKFGSTGGGPYSDSADGVLVTPPVQIGTGAVLSFWHWIAAEQNDAATAWDGAVVEISTDGGAGWSELIPQGGYTHTIVDNPASPFPPGYPCWSGSFGWRQAQFDLAAFSGSTVQIRLRFGSDGYVTYEGWYIDDLVLNPGLAPTGVTEQANLPASSTILGIFPSPAVASATVSFAVAPGAGRVDLDILDVTGRRIRTVVAGTMAAGYHTAVWDGRTEDGHAVGRGVYFARLRAGREESAGKILLTR